MIARTNQKHKPDYGNGRERGHEPQVFGVYIKSLLTMKTILSITEIGKNVKQNLEKKIVSKTEGRCIAEGFVKPNSVQIVSYSCGTVNSENIEFCAVFECMISHPFEGMLIECDAKTITKAGIHAEVNDDGVVPITVFVARDHNYTMRNFNDIKEHMKITVKVIGIRYELNDPYICVIGMLANTHDRAPAKKHKMTIMDE